MITYKIVDDVVKIKHIIKLINDMKNKSRFEGDPHELIEEKIERKYRIVTKTRFYFSGNKPRMKKMKLKKCTKMRREPTSVWLDFCPAVS